MRRLVLLCVVSAACSGKGEDSAGVPVEPLSLPEDAASIDVPVGVRTVDFGGTVAEVWYPAAESAKGQAGERVELADIGPQVVLDTLGPVDLPGIDTLAVRGAPLRNTGEALAVVLFSHGFGGFEAQSVDLTSHLAGRGYVVLSTEHAGRSLNDLLPCLFSPPLDGCGLSTEDPGPADLGALLDALADDADFLDGHIDLDRLAVVGHSAGGGTTSTLANTLDLDAAVVMAAPPVVSTDVPVLLLDGSCDGIVTEDGVVEAFSNVSNGARVRMVGAGHLAFSDICDLDFGTLAQELLLPRDDVNAALLDQLVALGTDGCPGGTVSVPDCGTDFLPLETTHPVVRATVTRFLDLHVRGVGTGLSVDYGEEFEVTLP